MADLIKFPGASPERRALVADLKAKLLIGEHFSPQQAERMAAEIADDYLDFNERLRGELHVELPAECDPQVLSTVASALAKRAQDAWLRQRLSKVLVAIGGRAL